MKKLLFAFLGLTIGFTSCDKVKNAYPEAEATELDQSLFPGDWSTYPTPVFSVNTNTNRNVLIEDFTGHTCKFCPAAAELAHDLEKDNPGRVFTSAIHSGPTGAKTGFQAVQPLTIFTFDFTTPIGLNIGEFFGNLPGSSFFGNPAGNVSRVKYNNALTLSPGQWTNAVNALLSANDLKVNIQSKVNYYDETKGAFVHVEVDVLDDNLTSLGLVVAFHEDSIVKPQVVKELNVPDYVHRDLLKDHINGGIFGQTLSADLRDPTSGKYNCKYSYRIPNEFAASNAHFLIYVVDLNTYEIYQVIKNKVIE